MNNILEIGSTIRFTRTGLHVRVLNIKVQFDSHLSPIIDVDVEVVFKETSKPLNRKLHDKWTTDSDLLRSYLLQETIEIL